MSGSGRIHHLPHFAASARVGVSLVYGAARIAVELALMCTPQILCQGFVCMLSVRHFAPHSVHVVGVRTRQPGHPYAASNLFVLKRSNTAGYASAPAGTPSTGVG